MTGNELDDDEGVDGPEGGAAFEETPVGDPPGLAALASEADLPALEAVGGVADAGAAAAAAAGGLPCSCSWLRARFWLEVAADASVRAACEDDDMACPCSWTRVLRTNAAADDDSSIVLWLGWVTATMAQRRRCCHATRCRLPIIVEEREICQTDPLRT